MRCLAEAIEGCESRAEARFCEGFVTVHTNEPGLCRICEPRVCWLGGGGATQVCSLLPGYFTLALAANVELPVGSIAPRIVNITGQNR